MDHKTLLKTVLSVGLSVVLPAGNVMTSLHESPQLPVKEPVSITISAVGDCTIGSDLSLGYQNSFIHEFERQGKDYAYFFSGVQSILEKDDLTIANLETALTNATKAAEKKFRFKGPPGYANILSKGSVEVANLANNHTYDYFETGYKETVQALDKAGVQHFGRTDVLIVEVKGIKIGLTGNVTWEDTSTTRNQIKADVEALKAGGAQLVIASFHWGNEATSVLTKAQKNLGRYAVDCGADLVLGHHPHVLQAIEDYKGKFIVYSLANFSFGGNRNPSDKDTMIFQQTFTFTEAGLSADKKVNIIPCLVSSVKNRNDFKPVIAIDKDRARIVGKLKNYSKGLIDPDLLPQ